MKTIIAGNRDNHNFADVEAAVASCPWEVTMVISGDATGIDSLGKRYAEENVIPLAIFPVTRKEWATLGKKAGPLRNARMASFGEALIAVWDGQSRGTKDMIERARIHGLRVHIHYVGGYSSAELRQ